jgi:hypothetical protein
MSSLNPFWRPRALFYWGGRGDKRQFRRNSLSTFHVSPAAMQRHILCLIVHAHCKKKICVKVCDKQNCMKKITLLSGKFHYYNTLGNNISHYFYF